MPFARLAWLSPLVALVACGSSDPLPSGDSGAPVDTVAVDTGEPDMPLIELTDDLCDDPSNVQPILDALQQSDGGEGPSYGTVNTAQVQRMLQNPTEGPIYLVNLIQYREQAVYADGRSTTLTGREANDLYDPLPLIAAIGGRPVYTGPVSEQFEGADAWDDVAIVQYPCPLALFALGANREFQETSIHKDAGLEKSTILVSNLRSAGDVDPEASPYPPSTDDPWFDRVQVVRRGEAAAFDGYVAGIAAPEAAVGIQPLARFDVQGAYIGDGQEWDEVWIDRVPSLAALDARDADPAYQAAAGDRDLAIDGAYSLGMEPELVALPDDTRLGFEILQVVAPDEIRVWLNTDLTQAQFDAITLPQGWRKNQPREGDPDGASFARSPDATEDGPLTVAEHFGHPWEHNATIIEANTPLDDVGLLRLNRIAKFHEIRFDGGRTLKVLVSPEGTAYVRVSRDAGRTSDMPTLPEGWQIVDYTTTSEWVLQLPNPTDNIRTDNEDSFQGPIDELQGLGAE